MILFGSSAAAAIVKLRCPRCGCVQARARGPENTEYTCRECFASFRRASGEGSSREVDTTELVEAPPRR